MLGAFRNRGSGFGYAGIFSVCNTSPARPTPAPLPPHIIASGMAFLCRKRELFPLPATRPRDSAPSVAHNRKRDNFLCRKQELFPLPATRPRDCSPSSTLDRKRDGFPLPKAAFSAIRDTTPAPPAPTPLPPLLIAGGMVFLCRKRVLFPPSAVRPHDCSPSSAHNRKRRNFLHSKKAYPS